MITWRSPSLASSHWHFRIIWVLSGQQIAKLRELGAYVFVHGAGELRGEVDLE